MTAKKEATEQPAAMLVRAQRDDVGSRHLREARVELIPAQLDLRKAVNVLSTSSADNPAPNPFVQSQNVQSGSPEPAAPSNQGENQSKTP